MANTAYRRVRGAGLAIALGTLSITGAVPSARADVVSASTRAPFDVTTPATVRTDLPASDRDAAMSQAQASGQRVEVVSERTETQETFANPDGTWTTETYSEPVRVQASDGTWNAIDPTLQVTADGIVPKVSSTDLALSPGGDRDLLTMHQDGHDIVWKWPTTLPAPEIRGSTATYRDVVPNGDLEVSATDAGFEENLVLRQAPTQPIQLAVPVVTDGAQLSEDQSGAINLSNDGHEIAAAPAPLMWDASTDKTGTPDNVAPVDVNITDRPSATSVIHLDPNTSFLQDPTTQYPVTIDPAFTTQPTGDAWVMNTNFTTGQVNSDELRAGTYDNGGHVARSFLHFALGNLTGKHIWGAQLTLRNWFSNSCDSGTIRAQRILDSWSGPDLTWNNQPGAGADNYADFTPAYGGGSGCGADDAVFQVHDMVQGWADGFPNNGIRIKAYNENNNATWRKYRSVNYATASLRPRLDVQFNNPPFTPPTINMSPGADEYVTSTAPTLQAVVSDPDFSTVRADFTVTDTNSGQVVFSQNSGFVSSNQPASVSIPADTLHLGGSYTVSVKADDGTDTSAARTAALVIDPQSANYFPGACQSSCTPVTSAAQTTALTLAGNETRQVSVDVPGLTDPSLADQVVVRVTGQSSGNQGSLQFFDPENPALTSNTLSNGWAGDAVILAVPTAPDGSFTITNRSGSARSVSITALGWTSWSDASDQPDDASVDQGQADIANGGTFVPDAPTDSSGARMAPAPEMPQLGDQSEPIQVDSVDCSGQAATTADDGSAACESFVASGTNQSDVESQSGLTSSNLASSDTMTDLSSAQAIAVSPTKLTCDNGTRDWEYVNRSYICGTRYTTTTGHYGDLGQDTYVREFRIITTLNVNTSAAQGFMREEVVLIKEKHTRNTNPPSTHLDVSFSCQSECSPEPQLNSKNFQSVGDVQYDETSVYDSVLPSNPGASPHHWPAKLNLTEGHSVHIHVPYEQPRCDSGGWNGLRGSGCIFEAFVPIINFYTAGRYPESAKHIKDAIAAGRPTHLVRKFWAGHPNLNRRAARRKCRALPGPGDCDEYAFASTYQGCEYDPHCSVRRIDPSDNRGAGNYLGSFYQSHRIAGTDAFTVAVDPKS